MSKYQRSQPSITRHSDENISEDHWLKQFEKKLAVQPRTQESLFDQISAIMNGTKSKYPSVEAAVNDMKQRSGLTAYLDKINKAELEPTSDQIKTAQINMPGSINSKKQPIVFEKCPQASKTLDNLVKNNPSSSVPALISRLHEIHGGDVTDPKDWEDNALIIEVANRNLQAKKLNPATYDSSYSNLGARDSSINSEIDPSNTDAFHALTPAKL